MELPVPDDVSWWSEIPRDAGSGEEDEGDEEDDQEKCGGALIRLIAKVPHRECRIILR
jgi:hypothetical protein